MTSIVPNDTYSKLSAIVDHACIIKGLSVPHYFDKLLSIACWGLRELNLDQANDVITEMLPISDVNTVTIPPNAVDWVKIGIPYGQYVKILSINGDLNKMDRTLGSPAFTYEVNPGWLPNGIKIQNYGGGFEFLNYGGRSLFAISGGLPNTGHFTVIKRKDGVREVLLDNSIPGITHLYVEYIATGLNPCGETIVDTYLADYVLKYILQIYEENLEPNRTESAIFRRKQDTALAEAKVRGRKSDLTPDTLLTITRASYRLTEKA